MITLAITNNTIKNTNIIFSSFKNINFIYLAHYKLPYFDWVKSKYILYPEHHEILIYNIEANADPNLEFKKIKL
jgi:hypothetical protein